MSRKPVEQIEQVEIKELLNGYSHAEWALALKTTPSSISKWCQRGRVPKETLELLRNLKPLKGDGKRAGSTLDDLIEMVGPLTMDKSTDKARGNMGLADVDVKDLVKELESRGWEVSLKLKE